MIYGYDTSEKIKSDAKLNVLKYSGPYGKGAFIGRYLTNAPSGEDKCLEYDEVKFLSDNDINIVSIFETYGGPLSYFTMARGISDARASVAAATDLGQPSGKPIYFAVDIPIYVDNQNQVQAIWEYFVGVSQILSDSNENPHGYTLGVYGCEGTCLTVRAVYPNAYTMQCNPKTNGSFSDWNLDQSQYNNGNPIWYNGVAVTIDVVTAQNGNYGGWKHTHTYPSNWTPSSDGIHHHKHCTNCGFVLKKKHSFPSAWSNYGNAKKHRKACTACGAYKYEPHSPNAVGTKCTKCGYEGNIILPSATDGEDSNE
ncbi:MAG: DUF1906 domain-containing protein [Clostridiales bacterium]|nr:DUF1906 domain-containing protein [Clostridiales bacterium]